MFILRKLMTQNNQIPDNEEELAFVEGFIHRRGAENAEKYTQRDLFDLQTSAVLISSSDCSTPISRQVDFNRSPKSCFDKLNMTNLRPVIPLATRH